MKGLKILAVVLGALIVLLALVFVLALTPAVQTWAVRKAVAGQPGLTLEVARVSAGFSAADIGDLRFSKDGLVVTAKGVSARYSAWDYLTKKRINVDSVTVQDLVVDLRNAKPAVPASPSAGQPASANTSTARANPPARAANSPAFEGALKQAQLPFDVRLASLNAKGRALLPDQQTVDFDLSGSDIETGKTGKLSWTVAFADATTTAALRGLRATGGATLHVSADRRIDTIEVDTVAAASGPKLPADQIKLTARAEQAAAGGDETYTVSVGLVRGTAVEPLLKSTARYTTAAREIAGTWELAVRSEQLAGLLAGLGLPEVAANGSGKFSLKPDTRAVSASGDLQGRASELQKLSPELETIGSVQFKTTFDGGLADNVARLEQLNVEVTGADGRKFAQIGSLQKIAYNLTDKKVTLANPQGEVARIALQQVPLAWAQAAAKPMVIESGDLSLVLAVEAEPDGSRIRARAVEPLAIRALTVRSGDRKLADRVSLTARPSVDYSATRIVAQLAELSLSMPSGDAVSGTLSADVTNLATTPAIAFAAQVQAKIVEALKPYLPAGLDLGPLAVAATLEGRHEGQTLTLAKMTATANRQGGSLLAALDLQQPVRANLKTTTFAVANPEATAARIRLGEIPLAWAEGFVAKSKFAGAVAAGTLDVSMRSVEDLTLVTAEPLALRGVGATIDGKPLVQALDLSVNLTATKRGETIAYDVRRIDVKQGPAALVGLTVAGEAKLGAKLTLAAKGNIEADVAALTKQPALADFATLASGRVAATFEASMGDALQAKAALTVKNLVAKQDNRALGDLELTLNAAMKPDGSGTVTLPLTLTNATRKSDLAIDGTFGKAADGKTFLFTGKVASRLLVVDDFQPLAGLAPAGEKNPKPAATPKSKRDTEPFWNGVNGKLEVDLKRVLYGKDYVIGDVHGTAVITNSRLALDGLEGKFKENPFKVTGGVAFAAQQPQPYTLTGSADVANFDVGEFLRAANPGEKPAIETKATVSAKLNGNGTTVDDLMKNAFGKFEVTGTQGTMRLLARKGAAGTAVNLASFGLAVLGAARGSDTATALSEIARLLNEVPFDSVNMQIERGADLSFKLTSMELISPIMRMTGSGAVASKSTDDLQNAPMNVLLQLGAKGELGFLLQRVGMLGANKDPKGYQLMSRSFTVGGTPAKPDSSSLWKILGEAALGALAR